MKYISIDEQGHILFKSDEINEITDDDKPISDEIYQHFFDMQSAGHQYRILDIDGETFEEIFEEYTPTYQETTEEQIARLTEQLHSTDSMVVECYECSMCGETSPYDIHTLHQQRQALRDEIASLQSEQ